MRAAWAFVALAAVAVLLLVAVPAWRATLREKLPPKWSIALSALRHGVEVDHDIAIAMPDGTRLAASLYRPRNAPGPLPTILVQEPYDRLRHGEGLYAAFMFTREGYAVLLQDLRGTGASQGELLPWRNVADDGVATLDWIVRQPWSDGKVGTFGCSGLGETQLVLAARNHPHHLAMIPSGAGGAVGSASGRHAYFGVFEGGVFQLASGFGWFVDHGALRPDAPPAKPFDRAAHLRTLPVSTMVKRVRPAPNGYDAFVGTPMGDARWAERGYLTDADRSSVPAFVINSWGDQTVGDTLALAEAWRLAEPGAAATRQKVLIAPGIHCHHEVDGSAVSFGSLEVRNAAWPYRMWYRAWFDHWLRGRGEGLAHLAPYTYFMIGEDRWLSSGSWPPGEARVQRWYLGSGGRANSRKGNGTLATTPSALAPFDTLSSDPHDPVPTRGGPICCTGELDAPAGPADQSDVEARDDVLVYTSAPLESDLRIAGPLQARLYVESDAPDADLVVRLVHVFPDGRAIGIQEGALRLRYRGGFTAPRPMRAGERYEATVDLRAIAYRIPRGHKLRLHVAGSSFPRVGRNRHTGAPDNAAETNARVANSRIFHDAQGASHLLLHVLP